MIHSDWGDWLPRAVAEADPEGVALWYLGCNGFVLKSAAGATVFVDPYLNTGDPPRTVRMIPVPFDPEDVASADAILATHEHSDHVDGPSQAPILAETGATFYGPPASVGVTRDEDWTERWDVALDQFATVAVGDSLSLGDLEITATRANDPDAEDSVGYVFEHDAGTFFHGGDARPGTFERVGEEYDIDLAALAFGSEGMILDKETREPTRTRWYNDENQIVDAAAALRTDRLLPTHWDMWKGLTADPTALHDHIRSFAYPRTLDIAEIGDRVDL
jgi:L-ascorbate 6-phosphate lactonase